MLVLSSEIEVEGRTLASILPTLVSGLYKNKLDLVREYCQNAYDAILLRFGDTAAIEGKVELSIKGQNLTIHDNGVGMDKDVVSMLATIGFSTKDVDNQVGYRGIGRLSGICACETITFVTKPSGDPYQYSFEIRARALTHHLDLKTKFSQHAGETLAKFSAMEKSMSTASIQDSFTTVVLDDMVEDARELVDEDDLISYLETNLPVPVNPEFRFSTNVDDIYEEQETSFPNIKVFVNDEQIFKPYQLIEDASKFDTLEIMDSRGKALAVAWYTWDPKASGMVDEKRVRGLVYRYRGFTVGTTRDMRTLMATGTATAPDWFAGEVIVLNPRIKVSSDRSRFEDSRLRRQLERSVQNELGVTLNRLAHDRSKRTSKNKVKDEAKEMLSELRDLGHQERHISPDEMKKRAKKAVAVQEKLKKRLSSAVNSKERQSMEKLSSKLAVETKKVKRQARRSKGQLVEACNLDEQAAEVLETITATVRKRFGKVGSEDELITDIEKDLLKKFGS